MKRNKICFCHLASILRAQIFIYNHTFIHTATHTHTHNTKLLHNKRSNEQSKETTDENVFISPSLCAMNTQQQNKQPNVDFCP